MEKEKQNPAFAKASAGKKKITVWKVLEWIAGTILVIFLLITGISLLPIENNIELLSIQSGSMEPKIKVGSLAISKPMGKYEKDDIIAFQPDIQDETIITHRIVEIDYMTGKVVTKGDANEEIDKETITPAKIKGKVIFWIPYFGYVVNFSKTLPGLIVIIIIPALIIIGDELIGMVKEINTLRKKSAFAKATADKKAE